MLRQYGDESSNTKTSKGAAVIVFPEETRTASGQLGDMKNGFALLAKRAGVPIVPVAIVGAMNVAANSNGTCPERSDWNSVLITADDVAASQKRSRRCIDHFMH